MGEWGNVRLDIRRAIVLQLERLGIAGEQVQEIQLIQHQPTKHIFHGYIVFLFEM
jgi:hypothetical protein